VLLLRKSDLVDPVVSCARDVDFLKTLAGPFYGLAICIMGLIGYVIIKTVNGTTASTHAVQYWWTSTIAYAHGWLVSFYMFSTLAAFCVVFTLALIRLVSEHRSSNTAAFDASAVVRFRTIAVHLVNVIIVTIVNAVYILVAVSSVSSSALLSVQAALGMFKLAWSTIAVPQLLLLISREPSLQLSHWIFMVLFVFLGAPFASSFSESSSCFLYLLRRPLSVRFSFYIQIVEFLAICGDAACTLLPVTVAQSFQSLIAPPWIYSYQCSTAVVTAYAPVLMLSYLVSGLFIPLVVFILFNCSSTGCLPAKEVLPAALLKVFSAGESTALKLLNNGNVSELGRKMTVKYILNFSVMMTFGLAVPLLAVAVFVDTIVALGSALVMLEKSVQPNSMDSGRLKQEFWDSFSLNTGEVTRCCYIVLSYVGVFWSLFTFDWIADVHGSLAGGLGMLIPLLMPPMIGYVLLGRRGLRCQPALPLQLELTSSIELAEVVNPVISPQTIRNDSSA
jgi:hypothetical protein